MNPPVAGKTAAAKQPHQARQAAPAGPRGAAMAPPAYGVEFLDQAQSGFGAAPIQREVDPRAGASLPPPAASGNRTGLPSALRAGVESLSGISMGHVNVHYNSSRPAQLRALAYAQGSDIHLGPGQEKHLPHEAWHVVQQAQGRVSANVQRKAGVPINDDKGLEREADVMGAKAQTMGTQAEQTPGTTQLREPGSVNSSSAPAQLMMGFELEMLILIDDNGRPVPEKTDVGEYGNHLTLDADQGPEVDAITPVLPETTNFDALLGYTGTYAIGNLTFTTVQAAINSANFWNFINARLRGIVQDFMVKVKDEQDGRLANFATYAATEAYGDLALLVRQAVTNLQGAAGTVQARKALVNPNNNGSVAAVTTELQRLAQLPANLAQASALAQSFLTTAFTENATGDEAHPTTATGIIGGGSTRYASILEIVTRPYSPETNQGRTDLIAAMTDAVQFADRIETADPRANRVQLNTINGTQNVDNRYFMGNPRQKKQTTDASLQCTFALDLAQLASFIKSTTTPEAQSVFHTKHDADYDQYIGLNNVRYHYRAEEEMAQAVTNATNVLTHFAPQIDLPNLRGLLILMCQYLRLGKYSFTDGKWNLDKNFTTMLSRTNLSLIRLGMPLAERNWLAGKEAQIKARLLHETGRGANACLLTDPNEGQARQGFPDVDTFIDNVLTAGSDGITGIRGNNLDQGEFGGFKKMNAEEIHPAGSALEASGKLGPVFELRNLLPHLQGAERFPRAQWLPLAKTLMTILKTLHERTDTQAARDTTVKTKGLDSVDAGGLRGKELSTPWNQ